MGKLIRAEYDAEHKVLRLDEALDEVADRERVSLTLIGAGSRQGAEADSAVVDAVREQINARIAALPDPSRPWMAFEGILSGEAGESMAKAIDEMFPIEE